METREGVETRKGKGTEDGVARRRDEEEWRKGGGEPGEGGQTRRGDEGRREEAWDGEPRRPYRQRV